LPLSRRRRRHSPSPVCFLSPAPHPHPPFAPDFPSPHPLPSPLIGVFWTWPETRPERPPRTSPSWRLDHRPLFNCCFLRAHVRDLAGNRRCPPTQGTCARPAAYSRTPFTRSPHTLKYTYAARAQYNRIDPLSTRGGEVVAVQGIRVWGQMMLF
jgi:hypothetical protein